MEQPPPVVLALVVADYVYGDDQSDKLFILGTRTTIGARSFPWALPFLAVYAAFMEGRGEITFRFRLVDADEEREAIAEDEDTVTFPDPLTEVELAIFLTDLVFPEPGDYRLQMFANGQFLRERRLLVIPLENPDQP